MRVAVVYPEVLDMARYRELRREFPPFGALYIAATLEEAGHEVRVFKISPNQIEYDFRDFDVVAFSISASATFNLFVECKLRSQFSDRAMIIAGGVHATLLPEQTLADLEPAAVAFGEGEDTILEMLGRYESRDFSGIDGVCYWEAGNIKKSKERRISRNVDRFQFPARHLIPESDFIMNDRMSNTSMRMTHIMPGRGCPFPCRYCASAQTTAQYRTGANVRKELIHLIEKYGIQGFAVVGNDFILSKTNVNDICGAIQDLNLQWATLSRVDRVDPVILSAMRSSGCYELEFGVESGSQRILDAMEKRATIEQVNFALRESHAAGIKNKVFLVHGYPGEDEVSTEETMRLLDVVGRWIERVSLFRFVPLPGTFVYNNALNLGIRGTPHSQDWDGDWGKFHIHHNHHHWWGDEHDFARLTAAYLRLREYVEDRWPSRFNANELPQDLWQEQSRLFARPSAWVAMQRKEATVVGPTTRSLRIVA
ncbi:radical SAM protein [Sorangium sp. So ce726]|uniref:B12-binding domain-containing radical SAM protein n=1 Tax=Sorangium sp. So ce726 TaxID=3133319 RepID=UPI003F62385A